MAQADYLKRVIGVLAGEIGERNVYHMDRLAAASEWIENELRGMGYAPRRLPFEFPAERYDRLGSGVVRAWNIEVELRGTRRPDEVIIAGAHYDSKVHTRHWRGTEGLDPSQPGTPGANDNGSGVAATLALARAIAGAPQERTIRFVFFVNEEPPFFLTEAMGSWVYARGCRDRGDRVVGMFTPETLGVYSRRLNTKRVPFGSWIGLPASTDYFAFLSNWASRDLVKKAARHFPAGKIAVRTVSLPEITRRMAWSDDWSFWQFGYPAFAVTDTAFMRHDDYHEISDMPDALDYEPFAEVTMGLSAMLRALANGT